MPGIMALRKRASDDKPLKNAKIVCTTHINAQTGNYKFKKKLHNLCINFFVSCAYLAAVLIETLVYLGASVCIKLIALKKKLFISI